jgi:hypothetical protein
LELPILEVSVDEGDTAWVAYVGRLWSHPRTLKLDISDTKLVAMHARTALQARWPDLPDRAGIEGYTLDEVDAEKLRCIAERLQRRDLHELLASGHVDALEVWDLYLRKAANDDAHHRQRTAPREWAATFDRRLGAYRDRWGRELGDYVGLDTPAFGDVERRRRRHLTLVLAAAHELAE